MSQSRLSLLLPVFAFLAGCTTATRIATPIVPAATTGLHGALHGGQQPIVGATINIYAVGTTGDGSAASSVLAAPIVTDANGAFDLANKVTCPSYTSLLYLVATGGNPGRTPPFNGTQISLISTLGQCGNPQNIQFLNVNEVTTVAAIYALAPFMVDATHIGSGANDAQSLADAFTLAWQFADITTGYAPGASVPAGTTIPVAQINTLANLLSACVNSAGGVSGDTSVCGQLFLLTTPGGGTPVTDAVTALLHLAQNPTWNTAALYNLILPVAPFQPSLTELPANFRVLPTYPSNFVVSPPSLNFGSTFVGETTAQSVTITNNTSNALTTGSITLAGVNPGDFTYTLSEGSGCPSPIVPGATCSIPVSFIPTATGLRKAYLVIANTSVNPYAVIPLTGTGTTGAAGPISVSPISLPGSGTVTLTNAGNIDLHIQGITFSPAGSVTTGYFSETDTCGTLLPAQSLCTITVSAHAMTASTNATMTIADDASTGPQTVALNFTSNGYLTEDSIDFGVQSLGTQGTSQFFIAKLPGNNDSTQGIFGTVAGADFTFPFTNGGATSTTCSFANSTCSQYLYFAPTALGLRSAYLSFPVGSIPVKGTGVGPGPYFVASAQSGVPYYQATGFTNYSPTSALQLSSLVGGSQTVTFNVRYTGTVANPIMAPVITGQHAGDFGGSSSCTGSPQLTCALYLTFQPVSPQSYTASGYIADSTDTYRQNFTVTVSTTGPGITVNPTTLTFPGTLAGTVGSPQSITATALSNDPIQVAVNGPFQITQGATCPATPCQISVACAPLASASPGDATGSLTLSDPATGDTKFVDLIGTTTVATTVNISPGSINFSSRAVNTISIPQTITVTNTGATNVLSFSAVSLIGTNPSDYVLTNNCTTNVVPGNACTIGVSFAPTVSGPRTASLKILSNSTSSPDLVTLNGTAMDPP